MIKVFKTLLIMLLLVNMQQVVADPILIEAESFQNNGGWVFEQQFAFQKSSPCLLANGMGKPVTNAKAIVDFPKKGKYHVWVRTINWTPSTWLTAGRFHLIVGGKELKADVGNNPGRSWQYAGRVKINKTKMSLELKDLTGFDSRFEAVYFSRKKDAPTNEPQVLEAWRRKKETKKKVINQLYDLVVIGGDAAGSAAAIAAAEKGLNVALINDMPLLSCIAREEISVHAIEQYGFFERIIQKIEQQFVSVSSAQSLTKKEKRRQIIDAYENIDLFENWQAVDVVTEDKMIKYVLVRHTSTGESIRLKAPLFVDCTADAWIGYWAGAGWMYGRDSRQLIGDYIYTFNDAQHEIQLKDAVVFESHSMGVDPFKANHGIPYRTLYSKDIKNLFMAGRNFSCSYVGQGSPIVLSSLAQMGCVVGYAAALCVTNNVYPRDVYHTYLSELMDFIKSSDDEKIMIQ